MWEQTGQSGPVFQAKHSFISSEFSGYITLGMKNDYLATCTKLLIFHSLVRSISSKPSLIVL